MGSLCEGGILNDPQKIGIPLAKPLFKRIGRFLAFFDPNIIYKNNFSLS
jgi:hypothetical protein